MLIYLVNTPDGQLVSPDIQTAEALSDVHGGTITVERPGKQGEPIAFTASGNID